MKTIQISDQAHQRLYEFLHTWRLRSMNETVDKLLKKLDEQARELGEIQELRRKLKEG